MVKQAAEESEEAKARAKGEAMADRVTGKAQSYAFFSLLAFYFTLRSIERGGLGLEKEILR